MKELIELFRTHRDTGIAKQKQYPNSAKYYEGYADAFDFAMHILMMRLEKENKDEEWDEDHALDLVLNDMVKEVEKEEDEEKRD